MTQGEVECGKWGECEEGTICDPNQNLCVPCNGSCGDCGDGNYCAAGYICQPITDTCHDKECGDDGEGGDCGECEEGLVCEDNKCIEKVTPEVVEQPEVTGEEETADQPDEEVKEEPKKDTSVGPQGCPEGYKMFFGKCVKDETQEPKKGGGGCSCTLYGGSSATSSAIFFVLLLGCALILRRRYA